MAPYQMLLCHPAGAVKYDDKNQQNSPLCGCVFPDV